MAKDIQDCIRKVVQISMNHSSTFVKTHPYVSFTLIFLLLLYSCFPALFWSVIYLTSFLSLAASIAKIYFSFGNAKTFSGRDQGKKNDAKPSTTRRLVRNDANAQSVRRRRSKEAVGRDDSQQTGEEEKSTVVSSTFNNFTVDKTALIEEHTKEIREVEVECPKSNCSQDLSPKFLRVFHEGSKKINANKGEDGDLESSASSTEEEEDERDKEENKKAVEWSEDDQKNLMDLGLSEIEKNKRLESLIAKRRARKLLSLQVRRTPINMDKNLPPFGRIHPIAVPRANPFPANLPSGQFSPMPGSAPSVLIPMQNPFDLPYDPQEEKPILTGGSFHQEFMPVLKTDMFCRHESFSLGRFYTGDQLMRDQQEASDFRNAATKQRSFEGLENSKLENQSDEIDADKIIEVELSEPSKPNSSDIARDNVHVQEDVQCPDMEGLDSVNNSNQEEDSEEVQTKMMLIDDSSGSTSASLSEQDEPFSRLDKDAILESLASRNISGNRDSRSEMDSFFLPHDKATHHEPTFSFASDLQVEVSEISSPRQTIDWSISSHDDEGNMENEMSSGSEEIWAGASHHSGGVEENNLRLRDIHEVRENDGVEVGFSGTIMRSEDPVAFHKMAETTIPGSSDPTSGSSTELPDGSQDQTSAVEKSPQVAQSTHDAVSDKPEDEQQPSHSAVNSRVEFYSYNVNYPSILRKPEAKNFMFGEKDIGAELWAREGGRSQAEWSMASSPTSVGYPENHSEIMEEHRNIFEYCQTGGENNDPKASEDFGGESSSMSQPEKMDDMLVEEHGIQESTRDENEHQNSADQMFPGVEERSCTNQAPQMRLLQSMMAQLVPFASVSSLSPTSVLQPKFSIDQRTLSNFSEDMHAEIQQFHRQIDENDVLNERRGESWNATEAETSQGPSNVSSTSTMEAQFTEIGSEQVSESLTIPESTTGLLKPEGDSHPGNLEVKYKRCEEIHEPQHGESSRTQDSNLKIEDLAETIELEQQHPLSPDNGNQSGPNKHFEAVTGIDTTDDIKEVDSPNGDAKTVFTNNHFA